MCCSLFRLPYTTFPSQQIFTPIKPSIFHIFPHLNTQLNPQSSSSLYSSGTMFRTMSTRIGRPGYKQLISEPTIDDYLSDPKFIRSRTLPPNFFDEFPVKIVSETKTPVKVDFIEKQVKKVSKVHPLFSVFEKRSRKKRATAKPEFSRYMQYLKEGGSWDPNSVKPVIY